MRLAGDWVRDEQFESPIPIPPAITTGAIVAHSLTVQGALAGVV